MSCEVYKVTHIATGKIYIGCTTRSFHQRWLQHLSAARRERTKDRGIFSKALAKYGPDAFKTEVIERATCQAEMFERERYWIAHYDCIAPRGYNLTGGGEGLTNISEQTRRRLSDLARGNKIFLGRKHTPETKAKISAAAVRSPEHLAAISLAQKGKVTSPETRAKISSTKLERSPGRRSPEQIREHDRLRKRLKKQRQLREAI